jgi:hypothetical protein
MIIVPLMPSSPLAISTCAQAPPRDRGKDARPVTPATTQTRTEDQTKVYPAVGHEGSVIEIG